MNANDESMLFLQGAIIAIVLGIIAGVTIGPLGEPTNPGLYRRALVAIMQAHATPVP